MLQTGVTEETGYSSGSRGGGGGGGGGVGGLNPPFRVCFFCLSVYENSHGPGP